MKFRLKAFGVHLLCSATVLTVALGALYLGWYYWPGWYLADVVHVIVVMVGVDVVLGPLLTFVIAKSTKPRRELARDVGIIVACQLAALVYGTTTLWNGRPLYYAFSLNSVSIVQAFDINRQDLELARKQKAPLLPHWYSRPRWIWAPLPQDSAESANIIKSVLGGGSDVVAMPQYYQPYQQGLAELRTQLKKVDEMKFFLPAEKKKLKERMQAAGLATDKPDGIVIFGRGRPVLAVVDPASLRITAIIKAT